jgi:hypothetical protein
LPAGQKFECPVLALVGVQVLGARGYGLLGVWSQYAGDVRGNALPVGSITRRGVVMIATPVDVTRKPEPAAEQRMGERLVRRSRGLR